MGQDSYNAVFQLVVCLGSTLSGPGTFPELLQHSGGAVSIRGQGSLIQGRDGNGSTSVPLDQNHLVQDLQASGPDPSFM